MMDREYIIENNMLEQYLLGDLNRAEQLQVEEMLQKDADLKAQYSSMEIYFEKLARENSITPPGNVKDLLFSRMTKPSEKVVPRGSKTRSPYQAYFYVAAAIAAILFIGSFWMYNQISEANQQIRITQEENSDLKNDVKTLNDQLTEASFTKYILDAPETEKYEIKGNAQAPDVKITGYINHKYKAVVIDTKDLPVLDDEHDYQMWSDVEGNMVNMGVIDKNQDLLVMNYIDKAESLNITMEPAGGSEHPTVSNLVANIILPQS